MYTFLGKIKWIRIFPRILVQFKMQKNFAKDLNQESFPNTIINTQSTP